MAEQKTETPPVDSDGDLSFLEAEETKPEAAQPAQAAPAPAEPAEPTPEPAQAATPPAPTPVTPAAPKYQHPARLKLAAIQFGAPADVIDETPFDELYDWVQSQEARQRAAEQARAVPPPVEEDDGLDKDFDPRVTKRFRAAEETAKEVKELKALLQKQQQDAAANLQRANANQIEAAIDALPEEYRTIFGQSGARTERQQDECFLAFKKTKLDFNNLPAPAVLTKKLQEAWDKYAGAPAKPAPKTNGNGKHFTEEEFAEAAVATPTHRTTAKVGAGNEADLRATAAQWFKDRGLRTDPANDDTLEGLPD